MKLFKSCPICNSENLIGDSIDLLRLGPHISRTKCLDCELIFANPMAESKELEEYYKNYTNSDKYDGFDIENLHLNTSNDNLMLKNRFLEQVLYYQGKRDHVKIFYNIFRFIVTTGSILLPALLSIGQMDPSKLPKNFENISYWCSWSISLSVTASNGFLQLFSLDKNYFTYSIVTEQLKTEGWQFFQLSGKYEQFDEHIECYKLFCKSIEGIKRKQVEQEFSSGKADNKKSYKKLNPDNTVSLINNPQPPPEIKPPQPQQPQQLQ